LREGKKNLKSVAKQLKKGEETRGKYSLGVGVARGDAKNPGRRSENRAGQNERKGCEEGKEK